MKCKKCNSLAKTLFEVLLVDGVVREHTMLTMPELVIVAEKYIESRNSQKSKESGERITTEQSESLKCSCGENLLPEVQCDNCYEATFGNGAL